MGWSSDSIARARVLKDGEELTSFKAVDSSIRFLCEGLPLLPEGGALVYIFISWNLGLVGGPMVSRWVPLRRPGVEELRPVGFLGRRDGRCDQSGLGGHPLTWSSVLAPHLLPCMVSNPRTACRLRGALARSGGLAPSQSRA